MEIQTLIKKARDNFVKRKSFTRAELLQFLREKEPGINDRTYNWKIHELLKRHVISSIKRGVYTITKKRIFEPLINESLKEPWRILKQAKLNFDYCIWNTEWLNEFTIHQATKHMTIIECPRDTNDTVYYMLKEHDIENAYINPDEHVMDKYVMENKRSIIVKPMVSRSPLIKRGGVILPGLEKILADIFCDSALFFTYQGRELLNIYERVLNNYHVSFSTLLRYAARRRRRQKLTAFLKKNFPDIQKEHLK